MSRENRTQVGGKRQARREYAEYIASDAWAEKRRVFWKHHGRRCVRCGSTANLHVHHHTYARLGREALSDLVGVCEQCHAAVHAAYKVSRAERKGCDLTAITEAVLGVTLSRTPVVGGRSRPAPLHSATARRTATPVKTERQRDMERRAARLIAQGVLPDTKAWRRSMVTDALTPNGHGFVPRHLRGAQRNGSVLVVAPEASRPSWDKRV